MDARNPGRLTYQDAINTMMSALGEHPFSDAAMTDGTVTGDVSVASQVLGEVSKAVQGEGWNFNTEHDYEIEPNADTKIELPSNVVRWYMPGQNDPTNRYVQRGNFLYDRVDHTFTIDKTLKLTLVWHLEFDELPETAKWYITIRAARVFQGRFLSSPTVHSFVDQDEIRAKADMMENEGDSSQSNFLNHSDVSGIVLRNNDQQYSPR